MTQDKTFITILAVSLLVLGAGTISNTISFQQDRLRQAAAGEDGSVPVSSEKLMAGFASHGLSLHPAKYWIIQ